MHGSGISIEGGHPVTWTQAPSPSRGTDGYQPVRRSPSGDDRRPPQVAAVTADHLVRAPEAAVEPEPHNEEGRCR